MKSNIVGVFLTVFIVYWAATNTASSSKAYLDLMSLIIVVGGSFSVSFMTNGVMNTFKMFAHIPTVFRRTKYDNVKITKELVEVSKKYHFGTLQMKQLDQSAYHPFVIDGIKLLHNKFDAEKLRTIMSNMMIQSQERDEKIIENIEQLSKYPPALGMMGTILGLVAVLKDINTPTQMSNIGPSMAIALITTLYGILLSNYVLQPLADNLQNRSYSDLKIRQLIAEAVILVSEGNDPVYIREVLLSFLTPEEKSAFSQTQLASVENEEQAA